MYSFRTLVRELYAYKERMLYSTLDWSIVNAKVCIHLEQTSTHIFYSFINRISPAKKMAQIVVYMCAR